MTPQTLAAQKLESLGENFVERMAWNLHNGLIYSSPTAFVMAHVYEHDAYFGQKLPCLWVEIMAGDMAEAWAHAPVTEKVCYLRRGKVKCTSYERLKHLCTIHASSKVPPLESGTLPAAVRL